MPNIDQSILGQFLKSCTSFFPPLSGCINASVHIRHMPLSCHDGVLYSCVIIIGRKCPWHVKNNMKAGVSAPQYWRENPGIGHPHWICLYNTLRGIQGEFCKLLVDNATNTRWAHSVIDKCTRFLGMHYTAHMTNGLTFHPKNKAMIFKCLAHERKCHNLDLNVHSDTTRICVRCTKPPSHDTP